MGLGARDQEPQANAPQDREGTCQKPDINCAGIEALNHDVEDEEDVAARETVKSKWTQLAKLVGEQRLAEVARDFVTHFETRTGTLEGKAMFVAMSRDICVELFDEIVKLRPEWAGTKLPADKGGGWNPEDGAIRIIMTGTATDHAGQQVHVYTKAQKKRLERRFKDAADPLRIVIVRDMWLTGFEAPCCHTMYVDKPMHGHNLMQAIAHVNRVLTSSLPLSRARAPRCRSRSPTGGSAQGQARRAGGRLHRHRRRAEIRAARLHRRERQRPADREG